jgi:hypothetical protein
MTLEFDREIYSLVVLGFSRLSVAAAPTPSQTAISGFLNVDNPLTLERKRADGVLQMKS